MPVLPTVSLSAAPNPVDEGSAVTVTARVSAALPNAGDDPPGAGGGHGRGGATTARSRALTIAAGATDRERHHRSTTDDADGDDEIFTVALGRAAVGGDGGGARAR